MQSFLVFFYLLDVCYSQCQENDLGGILGLISPELWGDGRPMDIAIYTDWKYIHGLQPLKPSQIIGAAYRFLEIYEKQYGYNFSKIKDLLLNVINDDTVGKAYQYAAQMHQQYHYNDW